MSRMAIHLVSVARDAGLRRVVATYNVEHQGPKTTLTLPITLTVDEQTGGASASIKTTGPDCETPTAALAALGDWLVRCGTALRDASEVRTTIPIEVRSP